MTLPTDPRDADNKVREYSEEIGSKIVQLSPPEYKPIGKKDAYYIAHEEERWVIIAFNEGGFNHTMVDLEDVVEWVRDNKPEMLED